MFGSRFNVRSLAVGGIGALAVAAAGCSTGDDTTTPQSSGDASSSASHSTPADDDGSASGDLVSWAGDFCGAVRPMIEKTQELDTTATDASDPAQTIQIYQDMIAQLGPAFSAASEAIASLDAPPVDNGDELKQQMITVLDRGAAAFDDVADQIADLDPNDPNAFESIGSAFEGFASDIQESSDALDAAFSTDEMKDAFDQASQCDGLDLGS